MKSMERLESDLLRSGEEHLNINMTTRNPHFDDVVSFLSDREKCLSIRKSLRLS